MEDYLLTFLNLLELLLSLKEHQLEQIFLFMDYLHDFDFCLCVYFRKLFVKSQVYIKAAL